MADNEDAVQFADLKDYVNRYGNADQEKVEVFLQDASAFLVSFYESRFGHPYEEGRHTRFDANATAVCCAMVSRVIASSGMQGATQMSQTGGSYSASVTFGNALGDMYITRSEKRRLGLLGIRIGSIPPEVGVCDDQLD